MRNHPDYFPAFANEYVNNLTYHAEVGGEDAETKVDIGVLVPAVADIIISGGSLASGKIIDSINPLFRRAMMGRYGRNVVVVASGAATETVRVRGLDYLGQPVVEDIVLNGATAVPGKKAFRRVFSATPSAARAGTTINVGIGNVLGLPFAATLLLKELVDDAAPAAGTFVPKNDGQSATSTDPRGTYTPAAGAVPNGARNIELYIKCKQGNLHGVRHFAG